MLFEYNKKTLAGVYKELEVNGIFLGHGKKKTHVTVKGL